MGPWAISFRIWHQRIVVRPVPALSVLVPVLQLVLINVCIAVERDRSRNFGKGFVFVL